MDTFCLIFKSFGDYALYGIGLWFAACAISPALKKWFKIVERNVRKNRALGRTFGSILGTFCLCLIVVSIRIQIVQSKIQSPVYQNQILLREHVKNFSIDLSRFAKSYGAGSQDGARALMDLYYPEINDYKKELYAEGIISTNLENLFEKHRGISIASEESSNLTEIALEFSRMADQLPTVEQNR